MLNRVLIGKNLNLHHIDWDAQTFNAIRQAKKLLEQISKNVVFYELPTGIAIHN